MIFPEIIGSLVGLLAPPVFDFFKKKFLKPKQDTPEATISTLATTKPEVISEFVKANVEMLKAKIDYFNRDLIGEASRWVIDLRGSIRPIFVILSLIIRCIGWAFNWNIDEGFKILTDTCISSWFGSRLIH